MRKTTGPNGRMEMSGEMKVKMVKHQKNLQTGQRESHTSSSYSLTTGVS